jgi:uncharacterized protein (TIGR00645 family)
MKTIEKLIETTLFQSRWLLAPLYLGLIVALIALLIKFMLKLGHLLTILIASESDVLIFKVLGLVDIVLIANLLLIIIFSGYENFVSKIDAVEGHVDKPDWMGTIDYSTLKLKVIGSIVAISSIELLRAFIDIHEMDKNDLFWLIIMHITFVTVGVLFALMERIAHYPHQEKKSEHTAEQAHIPVVQQEPIHENHSHN